MQIQAADNKTSFGRYKILYGTLYYLPKKEQPIVSKVVNSSVSNGLGKITKGVKLVIGADLKPTNPNAVNIIMKKAGNTCSISIPAGSFSKFRGNNSFIPFLKKHIEGFKKMIRSEREKGVKAFNVTLMFDETMI